MGGIAIGATLDPAHHLQEFGRRDVADRALPKPGEDVVLQPEKDLAALTLLPHRLALREPLAGDRLERVLGLLDERDLGLIACDGGIDAAHPAA